MQQVDIVLAPGQEQVSERDGDFDEVEPAEYALASREQEIHLCEALASWSPFDTPSAEIVVYADPWLFKWQMAVFPTCVSYSLVCSCSC